MGLTYADYCHEPGGRGFRQRDLTFVTQTYDAAYLAERYAPIDDRVRALSALRLAVLERHWPRRGRLLDFGCGTNRLAMAAQPHWQAFGYDVVEGGEGPRLSGAQAPGLDWDVVTFFDSLEHLQRPDRAVTSLSPRCVMVSVPWCHFPDDEEWFMGWRHRRPGEHLHFWDRESLDRFFLALGYRAIMHSCFEDEFRPNPGQREPNILTAIYLREGAS